MKQLPRLDEAEHLAQVRKGTGDGSETAVLRSNKQSSGVFLLANYNYRIL
jgi:hypothetical protein